MRKDKKDERAVWFFSVVVALVSLNLVVTPFTQSIETNGVVVDFIPGMGIRLAVKNNNDYSIFNVTLTTLETSGFVICGGHETSVCIGEIKPGDNDQFILMVFGIGWCSANANVSYEDHGVIRFREIQGELLLIGFFTWVKSH